MVIGNLLKRIGVQLKGYILMRDKPKVPENRSNPPAVTAPRPTANSVVWLNQNSTTASVSVSGVSTYTNLTLVELDPLVPLSDEEFKKLLLDSNEANTALEKAKQDFEQEHGIAWNPNLRLTSEATIREAEKIRELRDHAQRLAARVLTTTRK